MIEFRQKEFCAAVGSIAARLAPMVSKIGVGNLVSTGAMVGTTAAGSIIGGKQQKEATAAQEAMTESQNRQLEAQTKALNKLAKAAKDNPQVASQAGQIMQSNFSIASEAAGFGKVIKSLAKDRNVVKKVSNGLVTGAGMGIVAYGADKAIHHDAKKHGIEVEKPEENPGKRKKTAAKIAAGTGSVLALAYGAKKGYLPKNISSGINTATKSLKTAAKEAVWKDGKLNKGNIGTTLAFGAGLPAMSYIPKRMQKKEQEEQTERQYSATGALVRSTGRIVGRGIKKGATSVISGIGSFMSGGATKGTQKFAEDMIKYGKENKNKTAQTVGKFMKKHDKLTKVAAIPVGSAIAFKPWELGEKAVKSTAEVVDKNAFAYQKSQEKEIK